MDRFVRIERLLGSESFTHITQSSVTVIGLGAVGGHALEALVRSGVRKLCIVDFDTVSRSNINRQILATEETVGMKKTEAASRRILQINPEAEITIRDLFVGEQTLSELFREPTDYYLDAIDSVREKILLLETCWKQGHKTVSSMGAALRRDPAYIKTGDLFDTRGCPLARKVRTELKKRSVGKGIQVVYSDESIDFDFTPSDQDPDAELIRGRRRQVLGSMGTITGIFGLTAANLVLQDMISHG